MAKDRPTVFVTGASNGLGLAILKDLAVDHHVIGAARSPRPASLPQSKPHIEYLPGIDLANAQNLDALAVTLSKCDALINNAGVAHDGLLATQSTEAINELLQLNLFSVLYLTKLYIRERLAAQRPGIVVTISSVVANRGYSGLAAYSATKGALTSMTRALAREMGPKGFRFNAVLPGFIETDMTKSFTTAQRDQMIRRTPLGRLGSTDDVCPLIRFLISPDAAYITGQEFVVDGGLTA